MTPHDRPARAGSRTRRLTAGILAAALSVTGMLAGATSAAAAEPEWASDPASHVNTLDGTGIGGDVVGSINNFPGATVPFGMVQFSPDSINTYAGYQYHNDRITGFSMNHASAGCNVFGDIPVLPWNEDIGGKPWEAAQYHDDKEHKDERGEPGYYTVPFFTGIVNELTATDRVGLIRATYPQDKPATFMVRPGGSLAGNSAADLTVVDSRTVTGSATTGNFCGKGNSYRIYFSLEFDQDFVDHGTWDREAGTVTAGADTVSSKGAGGYFTFPSGTAQVQAKIAVSYVSVEGAQKNMAAEMPGFDFDGTRTRAYERWNEALSRIQVSGGTSSDLRGFYTGLYRSLLHPNLFDDVDGRYIGFDDEIHEVAEGRHQYANFSDWDTYRTLIPLQTMLFPDVASDMASSLVHAAEQSGSLPRWPVANSATGQMTGDSVTALVGQIHAFGGTDFDAAAALGYMVRAADDGGAGLRGYVQRPGAAIYNERQYAPQVEAFRGDHQIVGASVTLEWSVDDFVISRLADALGDRDTAARFQTRSSYWQNLFDPSQNAIAPRAVDGTFLSVADQGSGFGEAGFDEGNAEQYLWMVPQNITGLAAALGGRDAAAERLDTFTSQTLNSGTKVPYLWAGNEPNFLVPWIYNYLGQPWKTQALVDRIRHELFSPGPDGAPGNDDLGAMSSWYVWASLGLVPATPGTSVLTVNSPAFDHVRIALGNGGDLRIDAAGATSGARYVSGMTVNGTARESTALPAELALTGGTVELSLSAEPDTSWATSPEAAPPAFGDGGTGFAFATASGQVSTEPGGSAAIDVAARGFGADLSTLAVTAESTQPGITARPSAIAATSPDAASGTVEVTVGAEVPEGFYPVALTATASGFTRTATVVVAVSPRDGFSRAMNLIGTATAETRGGANFDNAGNSYSREELAKAGLTPGATFAVGDLQARWPGSPAGQPDAVAVGGQTIALAFAPTAISFVGAARDGGGQATATITLDDGTRASTPLALGDWVLPSQGGTPVHGNSVVAHQDQRYSGPTGAYGSYVFATAPYLAPEGRTIVSVTLPSGGDADKLRLFAIASDAAAPEPIATTLSASPSAASVVEGTSVEVSLTVAPAAEGVVRILDETSASADTRAAPTEAAEAALVDGSARVTLTPAGVGTHRYRAVFEPADATLAQSSTTSFEISVTAAGPRPTDPTSPGESGAPGAAGPGGTAADRLGATGGDAGVWMLLAAVGLLGIAGGAGLLARGRRTRGGSGTPRR